MKTLQRRLRDRFAAARMAVPFLQEVELGHAPKLPPSVTRLSLNQMAAFVADEVGQSEPTMSNGGIWAQSRPVVHLAVHPSHGDDDSNVGDHTTSAASSVMSALSNLDTGQLSFALFANSANVAWSAPGILARSVRCTAVMA